MTTVAQFLQIEQELDGLSTVFGITRDLAAELQDNIAEIEMLTVTACRCGCMEDVPGDAHLPMRAEISLEQLRSRLFKENPELIPLLS